MRAPSRSHSHSHSHPRAAFFVLALTACGASPKSTPHTGTKPGQSPTLVSSPSVDTCMQPANMPAGREAAIDAYLDGHFAEASTLLDAFVKANPRDRGANFFRDVAKARLASQSVQTTVDAEAAPPVHLERLPTARTERGQVKMPAAASIVRLEKTSERANAIVDSDAWEKRNELVGKRDPEHIPARVAETVKSSNRRWVDVAKDYEIAWYGPALVITGENLKPIVVDTEAVIETSSSSLTIDYAEVVGRALVLGISANGYAKDAKGLTGYVAAYDLDSGALLWATDPLTSNVREVVIAGGSIVTGYGFTSEPDFLFVLDLRTGKPTQKIPLKSAPEMIRAKGDRIFVRTYDTDVVLRAAGGLPPAEPPAFERSAPTKWTIKPSERCAVARATAAIDQRDPQALAIAIAGLETESHDRELFDALRREQGRIGQKWRLDLAKAPLVRVASPSWSASAPRALDPQRRLAKLRAVPNVNRLQQFGNPFANQHVVVTYGENGKLPDAPRPDAPASYGTEEIEMAVATTHDSLLLAYGGRYLAVIHGNDTEVVLDLDNLRHPPKAAPGSEAAAVESMTYAQREGDVLYVCNGGFTDAKAVDGKKGFLTAIELPSGRIRWRSEPRVCSSTFVDAGERLLTGYGSPAEPSALYLVRKTDGVTVARTATRDMPLDFAVKDGQFSAVVGSELWSLDAK